MKTLNLIRQELCDDFNRLANDSSLTAVQCVALESMRLHLYELLCLDYPQIDGCVDLSYQVKLSSV